MDITERPNPPQQLVEGVKNWNVSVVLADSWCRDSKRFMATKDVIASAGRTSSTCYSTSILHPFSVDLFCSFSHNDLPWQLRKQFNNELNKVDLHTLKTTHTNIPKVKEGRLGAQVRRSPQMGTRALIRQRLTFECSSNTEAKTVLPFKTLSARSFT